MEDPPLTPLSWIRLDVGVWYAETLGFDDEMKGIYMSLLVYQWVKGRVPHDNMDQLSRVSQGAVRRWNELAYMFPDGRLPWLEVLRTKQTALHLARSKGGKARAAQAAAERLANGEGKNG